MRYAKLTDVELERVIRSEMVKYPYLVKRRKVELNPKYDVIDKNIHGVKIVNKKNQSVLKIEEELQAMRRPNVFTYSPDDRKVKTKLPFWSFAKA